MIEVVSGIVVKEGARGHFELAYGPGGAVSELYAEAPGYRGTTLLRDTGDPRRYLAVDLWETRAHREQAEDELAPEVAHLRAAMAEWIESRTELGVYRVLAEGTVRPRSRGRRAGTWSPHRRRG
jgi:heme-degrading monooxygenase HmoA